MTDKMKNKLDTFFDIRLFQNFLLRLGKPISLYDKNNKLIDTNDDGVVSDAELASAIAVLEKAKREKQRKAQKEAYAKFDFERFQNGNN